MGARLLLVHSPLVGRRTWDPVAAGLAERRPGPVRRARFAVGCPGLPLAMVEEAHPSAPHWPEAPAAYLQLSEAYADQAAQARHRGWPVTHLASHHLAPLTTRAWSPDR